eukprot:COSAG03_NODE_26118_length_261_cov_0.734568_1_plen_34_part_10
MATTTNIRAGSLLRHFLARSLSWHRIGFTLCRCN